MNVVAIKVIDKIAVVIIFGGKDRLYFCIPFAKNRRIFAKFETMHYFCKNNQTNRTF